MAKYLIHACNSRMWYVENFIVPSMIEQGIGEDDITVYNDVNGDGCLKSFIESSKKHCHGNGTWHLQDDIAICRDFKKRTEELDNGIVCGFACTFDTEVKPGKRKVEEGMWWSFPCIRIPDNIMQNCVSWVDTYVWRDPQYGRYVKSKKYDDLIFKIFVENYYPTEEVLSLAPNLVDHVDYLLGGSVINKQRTLKDVRSLYWDDTELIQDL